MIASGGSPDGAAFLTENFFGTERQPVQPEYLFNIGTHARIHGGRRAARESLGCPGARTARGAASRFVRRPRDRGTCPRLARRPTIVPYLQDEKPSESPRERAQGEQGVLSGGGEEVQRGAAGEIRKVRVRRRGHMVHPGPRRLRCALRGPRRGVGHWCHSFRVNRSMTAAKRGCGHESPARKSHGTRPARRYTRAPIATRTQRRADVDVEHDR